MAGPPLSSPCRRHFVTSSWSSDTRSRFSASGRVIGRRYHRFGNPFGFENLAVLSDERSRHGSHVSAHRERSRSPDRAPCARLPTRQSRSNRRRLPSGLTNCATGFFVERLGG